MVPVDRTLLQRELATTLQRFRSSKPNDRSELDRRFAIVITDLERAYAFYHTFIFEVVELSEKGE